MRVQHVLNGAQPQAAEALAEVDLPMLKALGAQVLGIFDLVIGPGRPTMVTLLAWPDLDTHHRAWFEMDRDAEVLAQRKAETARHGRRLFADVDAYLLQPMSWNMPHANFGAFS